MYFQKSLAESFAYKDWVILHVHYKFERDFFESMSGYVEQEDRLWNYCSGDWG